MRRNKTEDLADILDMLEATWFRPSGERERANGKNGRGKRLNERDVDEMMREIRTSLEENDGFPNDFNTDFNNAAPQALPADEERNALEEGFFKFRERFPDVSIVVAPPRLETVDTVDGEKRRLAFSEIIAFKTEDPGKILFRIPLSSDVSFHGEFAVQNLVLDGIALLFCAFGIETEK